MQTEWPRSSPAAKRSSRLACSRRAFGFASDDTMVARRSTSPLPARSRRICRRSCVISNVRWRPARARPAAASGPSCAVRSRAPGSASGSPTAGGTGTIRNQRLDAASLVYTKAPQIIRAFDEGALIRSSRGRFLAIPTENAPNKGTDGKRISRRTFPEHRFGLLRFVLRQSGPWRLVVDGLRVSLSRKTGQLRGFRRATDRTRERGEGLTTVVVFLVVPQVKLPSGSMWRGRPSNGLDSCRR